jgi:serine/threonine protein kinase
MIMSPLAETDLGQYLEELDGLPSSEIRNLERRRLLTWTGCLIRALGYLHEMHIKYRDIKPNNILIKQDTVYFADFGTSRIIASDATTGTVGLFGDMTRRYVAPEALQDGARRSRATDIFSLGCVFLEMATLLIGPPGSRERFLRFRESVSGTTAYSENAMAILQWIWHLWGHWNIAVDGGVLRDPSVDHGTALPDLAFMMLDPNPGYRITARELAALISDPSPGLYYLASVNNLACEDCCVIVTVDRNLPHHSVFKQPAELEYPENPAAALREPFAADWEDAKVK